MHLFPGAARISTQAQVHGKQDTTGDAAADKDVGYALFITEIQAAHGQCHEEYTFRWISPENLGLAAHFKRPPMHILVHYRYHHVWSPFGHFNTYKLR